VAPPADRPAEAYLDHAATTPLRPEAIAAMVPLLEGGVGNPSGAHAVARRARLVLDEARDAVAAALGCQPGDVVFTAGGTEADNLAITGVLQRRGGVPVCSAAEHHAVLHPVEHAGGRVVAVDPAGAVDLDALAGALDDDVTVVSVMLANNEVGTVTDLAAVAQVVRARAPRAVLHTDAVQAFAWLDVAALAEVADLVSVSAHKFGGPQGVGALVARPGVELAPLLLGGGQERERRSGTQNVAGIAGMAAAATATVAERPALVARVGALRDRLVDGLLAAVPGCVETVPRDRKVASSAHVCVPGVESEAALFLLDRAGVAASAASACASGALQASHVLGAMGVPVELAAGALRLSLGWPTTEADVERAVAVLPAVAAQLRRAA
jgi:cysteine desulfurase